MLLCGIQTSFQLELSIKHVDTIDRDVEIRSRPVLGFMEVSVRDSLCIRCKIRIGFNVSHVRIKSSALNLEGAGIEYVDRAVLESSLYLFELGSCALSSNVLIQLCEFNRTCFESSCPVGVKILALLNCFSSILEVRCPVDSR